VTGVAPNIFYGIGRAPVIAITRRAKAADRKGHSWQLTHLACTARGAHRTLWTPNLNKSRGT